MVLTALRSGRHIHSGSATQPSSPAEDQPWLHGCACWFCSLPLPSLSLASAFEVVTPSSPQVGEGAALSPHGLWWRGVSAQLSPQAMVLCFPSAGRHRGGGQRGASRGQRPQPPQHPGCHHRESPGSQACPHGRSLSARASSLQRRGAGPLWEGPVAGQGWGASGRL